MIPGADFDDETPPAGTPRADTLGSDAERGAPASGAALPQGGAGPGDHDRRALAEAAKQGDAAAWEAIYRGVYGRLRAYAARRVGADNAEDMVNETMTRAVAAVHRFEWGPAGFDGWLFGIARRVTADHLRRSERERRVLGRAPSVVHVDEPGDHLERGEEAEQVRRRFAQLSPSEREVLELRVVAGLSAEAVAVALGKRPGAVRMAQSRALANLRRLMDQP